MRELTKNENNIAALSVADKSAHRQPRGDKSPAQYMEALWANNKSASADFHELRRRFISRRTRGNTPMPPTPEQTALDLIRQAADSGAESLDLSNLGLTSLPPEIGQLPNPAAINCLLNTWKPYGLTTSRLQPTSMP